MIQNNLKCEVYLWRLRLFHTMEVGLQCPTLTLAVSVLETAVEVDGAHWLLISTNIRIFFTVSLQEIRSPWFEHFHNII